MSDSSEHPPEQRADTADEDAVADDPMGSTRPLVSFEPADPSPAAESAETGDQRRRGGSRLFPQLPDDPRLGGETVSTSDEPEQSAFEPLFEPTEPPPLIPRAQSDPQVPEPVVETFAPPAAQGGAHGEQHVEVPQPAVTAVAAEAQSTPDAGSSEADRFAQWARLDASASHWREGSQDYEERGVVGDEARTVVHGGTAETSLSGRNLPAAIAVGIALAALFFGALRLGEAATVALIVIVLVLAAAEFYRAARPLGYRPATLAGLAGVGGLTIGVHLRGVEAYPIVLAVSVVTMFCWFLVGVERDHPTANLAISVLGLVWVGGLGSFAALILREPNGDSMLIAAVIGTVAYDVGGYVIGRTTGQSKLSPRISPNKTHEGLIGGIVLSAIVTTLVLNRFPGVFPWTGSTLDALWLSLAVALAAPLGDLSQSLVKRDVAVKDMGSLLPGHGGVFDRFDALLFALPAAYFVGTYVVG